ncbi:DUF1697 domain-containing protein [Microbacterium sp.]|uniref:DUF1697 domain-containing protein n=1 Tax=Microbacterium sp. TaxID=51671 RepID=UPI003340B930
MTVRGALLLRAVNVGGRNRVPMAELRSLLSGRLGLENVSTYIASGNILSDLPADRPALSAEVRALIAEEFSVDTPVIVRTHDELVAALATNPFPDAAEDRMLHTMFLEGPADGGAIEALTPRLQPGERIALVGADLWIDYGTGGVQSTKLTTGVLDRALGVSGTARNLRTVRTLAELAADTDR